MMLFQFPYQWFSNNQPSNNFPMTFLMRKMTDSISKETIKPKNDNEELKLKIQKGI